MKGESRVTAASQRRAQLLPKPRLGLGLGLGLAGARCRSGCSPTGSDILQREVPELRGHGAAQAVVSKVQGLQRCK